MQVIFTTMETEDFSDLDYVKVLKTIYGCREVGSVLVLSLI